MILFQAGASRDFYWEGFWQQCRRRRGKRWQVDEIQSKVSLLNSVTHSQLQHSSFTPSTCCWVYFCAVSFFCLLLFPPQSLFTVCLLHASHVCVAFQFIDRRVVCACSRILPNLSACWHSLTPTTLCLGCIQVPGSEAEQENENEEEEQEEGSLISEQGPQDQDVRTLHVES